MIALFVLLASLPVFSNYIEPVFSTSQSSADTLVSFTTTSIPSVTAQKITKYTITATAGPHGKLKPKGKISVKAGGSKLFKAIPEKGYKAIFKVNGNIVKTGNVGKQSKYKLKNVLADTTLEALFDNGEKTPTTLSIVIIGLGESIKVTNSSPATFAGLAQSNAGIKNIKFYNDTTGESGNATGTTEWSANITLQEGDNILRFIAIAEDNSESEISTVVTYYTSLDFTTALSLSDDTLYVNESTDVTFTIGLENTTSAAVKLYQTNKDGGNLAELGEMKDDGTLPDEIQGDGIFTINQTILPSEEGRLYYRAGVTKGQESYYSETTSIFVTSHFTSEQVTDAVDTADSAEETFNNAIANNKSFKEAAEEVKNTLSSNTSIGAVDTTGTGGVWWITNDGILGIYHPTLENQKTGNLEGRSIASGKQPVQHHVSKTRREVFHYPASYLDNRSSYVPNHLLHLIKAKKSDKTVSAADEAKNEIKSKKGILISPYINNPNDGPNFGNSDDYYGPWQAIKDEKSCALIAETEILNNGSANVTIDSFKGLAAYGYIHFSTHGDNYFAGLLGIWAEAWGPNDFLKGALSQVVIFTGVKFPKNADGTINITGYESDIQAKRIAVAPDGAVALLPKFFSDYLETLPNSLVYLSACRTMYNNSMANTFLAKGAGGVVGYSDYVSSTYAQNTSKKIINDMLDGKTLSESIANAISIYGASDADADPAFLYYAGSNDLVLSSGDIKNTGFEDGVLTPWSKVGDGRIITQLGATSPTEGSYIGIISTGLGYTTSSGSIEQDFCASPKISTLSFDWNFFSEEFKEYCGSIFQDAFVVSISVYDETTDTWATDNELFRRNIDDLCGSVSGSDVCFDRCSPDDSGFSAYKTGWNNEEIDISTYAGKHLRVKFYSTDVGDSIYDSAILIDNIVITETP